MSSSLSNEDIVCHFDISDFLNLRIIQATASPSLCEVGRVTIKLQIGSGFVYILIMLYRVLT